MRIAVCDDDKNFLKELEEKLYQYSCISRVESYSHIETFFMDLDAGQHYDLVLMDLEWGEQRTGISYVEQLYNTAPHLPVIYVTGFNDRFAQHILLKETNLAGYLTKPIDNQLLEKYLRKVMDSRDAGKNLTFQQQGRPISMDVKRIVYLESRNHISVIYTDTSSYIVYEKLSALLSRLPDTFVQCHKSYVVNMRWIQRLEPERVLLKNGRQVGVSRSFRAKTREKVFRFMGLQI